MILNCIWKSVSGECEVLLHYSQLHLYIQWREKVITVVYKYINSCIRNIVIVVWETDRQTDRVLLWLTLHCDTHIKSPSSFTGGLIRDRFSTCGPPSPSPLDWYPRRRDVSTRQTALPDWLTARSKNSRQ